jgi:hypothetical protein
MAAGRAEGEEAGATSFDLVLSINFRDSSLVLSFLRNFCSIAMSFWIFST